tara:strand:+ start:31 stop:441 length:411 start_codon:yes stop_codon:yes gene_type:complete
MFDEIKNIKTNTKNIRSFGITIGIILFSVSALLYYYSENYYQILLFIASGFLWLSIIIPILLKPVYLVWMSFAVILGWIMTRVILSSLFYLIITPIGIITRLLGEDFLGLKTSNSDSYWNERDRSKELNQNYEKQF